MGRMGQASESPNWCVFVRSGEQLLLEMSFIRWIQLGVPMPTLFTIINGGPERSFTEFERVSFMIARSRVRVGRPH